MPNRSIKDLRESITGGSRLPTAVAMNYGARSNPSQSGGMRDDTRQKTDSRDNKPIGEPEVVRHVAGPADPATVHRMVGERLAEREPKHDSPVVVQNTDTGRSRDLAAYKDNNPTRDITIGTAANRLRQRGIQIDDAVEANVK